MHIHIRTLEFLLIYLCFFSFQLKTEAGLGTMDTVLTIDSYIENLCGSNPLPTQYNCITFNNLCSTWTVPLRCVWRCGQSEDPLQQERLCTDTIQGATAYPDR